MKKNLLICLFATMALVACNNGTPSTSSTGGGTTSTPTSTDTSSTDPIVTTLATPTNLAFDGTNLTFSAVENALEYVVKVKQGIEVLHSQVISTTSVNLKAAGLYGGHYTAEVVARNGGITSDPATLAIKLAHVDGNLTLEAEDYLIVEEGWNYSADSQASGGAYGLGFNDCGQGMYFRYYAFEAGTRDVTVAYATKFTINSENDNENPFMTLRVNGVKHTVVFEEDTGWFGDNHTTADATVQNIAFVQGWNEIYLYKNGTGSDSPAWGGYAQVDYIVVEGTNNEYDLDEFDLSSNSYTFEAEMAHWHWFNGAIRPTRDETNFSGYYLGSIDDTGDGVKFGVKILEAGTYAIRPVLGGPRALKVNIDDGDFVEKTFGNESGWNQPQICSDDIYRVELSAGKHVIEFERNGTWTCFDQFNLTKIVG